MANFEELDHLVGSCICSGEDSGWSVYAFKDNNLIIIDGETTLVAGAWPNPMAWFKTSGKPWRRTWKWANKLIVPNLTPLYLINSKATGASQVASIINSPVDVDWIDWFAQRHNALRAYARTFPDEILTLAMSYSNGQWHMMCFMASSQGAIDLVRSNPALAYCLVNHRLLKPCATSLSPMLEAQSWVYKKQRDILNWLGFPCTEVVQIIMQRVIPLDVTIIEMRILRKALMNEKIVLALSHLPQLNKPVLMVVNDLASLNSITPSVLIELSMQDNEYFAAYLSGIREVEVQLNLKPKMIFDSLQSIRSYESRIGDVCSNLAIFPPEMESESEITRLERLLNLKPHKTFESIEEIECYHNHLTLLSKRDRLEESCVPNIFPDPPFVGTDTIAPINTLDGLLNEEETMLHCVTERGHAIAEGMEYIYRVVAPVRATLSIRKNDMGTWECHGMWSRRSFDVDPEIVSGVFGVLTNSPPKHLPADNS